MLLALLELVPVLELVQERQALLVLLVPVLQLAQQQVLVQRLERIRR